MKNDEKLTLKSINEMLVKYNNRICESNNRIVELTDRCTRLNNAVENSTECIHGLYADYNHLCDIIKGINLKLYSIEYDILNNHDIVECAVCGAKITKQTSEKWKDIKIREDLKTFEIVDNSHSYPPDKICPKCVESGDIEIYKKLFEKNK